MRRRGTTSGRGFEGSKCQRLRAVGPLVVAVVLAALAPPLASMASAQEAPGQPPEVLDSPAHGVAAVEALSGELGEVAASNGLTPAALEDLLRSDPTAWLDTGGKLFYKDPLPPLPSSAPVAEPGPYPYAQTFLLHSQPGASRVIFLDFDGHTVSGTAWNASGLPAGAHPPFDSDGNPGSFSNAEQDLIQSVWQRVSEDFAPFGVDVTTQEPSAAAITRTNAADTQYGTRALITPSTAGSIICSSGCGGVAYIDVFDFVEPNHSYYQPAWIFTAGWNDPKGIAEAVSHEVGHNLGLNHDGVGGAAPVGYYQGQGSWAPIMGVGYYRPISQWSQGEYTSANNTQDDLAAIAANGAPLRADDHGDTTATATALGGGSSLTRGGVVSTRADRDVFSFAQPCAGNTSVHVLPSATSPNLDARVRILSSSGVELGSSDPTSGTVSVDQASGLSASLTTTLGTGTFFVEVDGVGALNPLNTGYSDYASLGPYEVQIQPCHSVSTSVSGVVTDGQGNPLPNTHVSLEGSSRPPVLTSATGGYSFTGLIDGQYGVRGRRACSQERTQNVYAAGATIVNIQLTALGSCTIDAQSWETPTAVLGLTGDNATAAITLPFPYHHQGVAYTAANVSTNGFVNFAAASTSAANTAIPNAAPPNAAIFAFWDDLVVDASASVLTATRGTAPNRRFVIEWRNVHRAGDTSRRFSMQAVLYENRNERLRLQYRGIDPGTIENGQSASIGKEDATGANGVQISYNSPVVFDGLSIRPK